MLRPGTTAPVAHAFPRAPVHLRTPPSATVKATCFPLGSVLARPPCHASTGPSADQRSPEHVHTAITHEITSSH
ncbi:hypothetical protein GCM10018787_18340 [Streptomyces thermodiastaticus]|nr:hypothetical protein GCM10018787_18340 [Streptomyces thermodiastaticus]